jgi:hypothetical protein
MFLIGRPINGISINGLEYVLDGEDGDVIEFETEEKAKEFLFQHGGTQEDLDECSILIVDTDEQ